MKKSAFTLVELLVTISIIGVLSTIVFVAVGPAARNSRDKVRRVQLDIVRRFLANGSCVAPDAGPGDYDLQIIMNEFVVAHPEAAEYVNSVPKDPRTGTSTESGFRYLYASNGHCALYANLENANEKVTLPNLTEPSAGGGTGTLEASSIGPNGSNRYYQISK